MKTRIVLDNGIILENNNVQNVSGFVAPDARINYIPNCIWQQEVDIIPSLWNNLSGVPFQDGVFSGFLQTAFNQGQLNQYLQVRWYGNNTDVDAGRTLLSSEFFYRPTTTYNYLKFEAYYYSEKLGINLDLSCIYQSEWKKVYKLGSNLGKNFYDSTTWAAGQASNSAYTNYATDLINVTSGFDKITALQGNPVTQAGSNCYINLTDSNLDTTKIYLCVSKYRSSKNVTFRTSTNALLSGYAQTNLALNTKSFGLNKNFIFRTQNNNPLRLTYDTNGSTAGVDYLAVWAQVYEITNP